MKEIICDRCGKKTNRFQGTRLTRNAFIDCFGISYDLCPYCADKFHKFMITSDFPEEIEAQEAEHGTN